MEQYRIYKKTLTDIADAIRKQTGGTEPITPEEMSEIINGLADNTYILVDDEGNEVTAVYSGEKVTLDATENDIRLGKKAATNKGVTVGDKFIPPYHTTESVQIVRAGSEVKITQLTSFDRWDYTKLQAIICTFITTPDDSVSAEKVVINGNVYDVHSVESLASVTKQREEKSISFGIVNTGDTPLLIRYFTYKEEI